MVGQMTRKKILILFAALVFLSVILTTPLSNIARFGANYDMPPSPEDVLSVEELNSFLSVWSEFMQKDLSQSMQQISLQQNSEIPSQVKRWLYTKGWNAERFFSTEQRLKELVAIATLQSNMEDNRRLLKTMPASSTKNLKKIISAQERQFETLNYNSGELALIRRNIYQIEQVLSGKAVLASEQ